MCELIQYLAQQTYGGISCDLQVRKLRLRGYVTCLRSHPGTSLNRGSHVEPLTPAAQALARTLGKQALFSPLRVGDVNKNFQDTAGLGRPLSDLLLNRSRAGGWPSHSLPGRASDERAGHCAFSLASGETTKVRESESPAAPSRFAPTSFHVTLSFNLLPNRTFSSSPLNSSMKNSL